MKGFFLLFTISLLVMLQIQRGMLETTTSGTVTTTHPASTTARTTPASGPAARTPARTPARATPRTTASTTDYTTSHSTSFATTKKQTGAAPALSSLGGVSILIILTNTFIQLFHLS